MSLYVGYVCILFVAWSVSRQIEKNFSFSPSLKHRFDPTMKTIAAYLLSNLTGEAPTAAKLEAILSSVGIEADSSRIETLIKELEGKDLAEVIAEGNSKLASVPSGGAAVASSGGAAGKNLYIIHSFKVLWIVPRTHRLYYYKSISY